MEAELFEVAIVINSNLRIVTPIECVDRVTSMTVFLHNISTKVQEIRSKSGELGQCMLVAAEQQQ